MSGPVVRTGATPEFWNNWDKIFGSKKSADGKSAAKKTATTSAGKKPAAKASKTPSTKKAPAKAAAKKSVSPGARKRRLRLAQPVQLPALPLGRPAGAEITYGRQRIVRCSDSGG